MTENAQLIDINAKDKDSDAKIRKNFVLAAIKRLKELGVDEKSISNYADFDLNELPRKRIYTHEYEAIKSLWRHAEFFKTIFCKPEGSKKS